jgi:hypothetical protein
MTFMLFTTTSLTHFTEEPFRLGQQVYEALAISEVLALADQHPTASIVITPEVEQSPTSDPAALAHGAPAQTVHCQDICRN